MPKSIPMFVAVAALILPGVVATPVPVAAAQQCVSTTIAQVTTYFANDPSSGSVIVFNSSLGVSSFKGANGKPIQATIVDRYASSGAVIKRARAGDAVKLCLTRVPSGDKYCNPKTDSRGRAYSAYDNRLRASFSGSNADHDCGGA
jgi:hypothetical protein